MGPFRNRSEYGIVGKETAKNCKETSVPISRRMSETEQSFCSVFKDIQLFSLWLANARKFCSEWNFFRAIAIAIYEW